MDTGKSIARKTSVWLAFLFYIVIGFEFFYMISPFAVYFYSVYQPGLEFINESRTISWLGSTFLPHIVNETSSPLLNNLTSIGFILSFGGALLFCYGAALVYWSKLTKKKMVADHLYRFVRHPQYGALIVCGFGMLLLWPRYIVLLSFVTMLFIYYHLARHEEGECIFKYGEEYDRYMNKTPMFFPLPFRLPNLPSILPETGFRRVLALSFVYVLLLFFGVQGATILRSWSLDMLFAKYADNSATIAVVEMEEVEIDRMLNVALNHDEVKTYLVSQPGGAKYINYLVPLDWSASEIPMHQQENFDHFGFVPEGDLKKVRLVITQSVADTSKDVSGKDIVLHSMDRLPVVEVIIDMKGGTVEKILPPVSVDSLENVPLPIF